MGEVIDVREAKAGPEMDAACARILGFTTIAPRVSENKHQAMCLVEKIQDAGGYVLLQAWPTIESTGERPYVCIVGHNFDVNVAAPTVPLAICRAFLLAYGVTEIEGA